MRLHFISRYCALSMFFSLIYGWIFRYNIAHLCTFQQNQIAGIHTFQYYCFCENHTFQYILWGNETVKYKDCENHRHIKIN